MGEMGPSGPLEEKRVLRGIFCHGAMWAVSKMLFAALKTVGEGCPPLFGFVVLNFQGDD
jgi:hypothetical protein